MTNQKLDNCLWLYLNFVSDLSTLLESSLFVFGLFFFVLIIFLNAFMDTLLIANVIEFILEPLLAAVALWALGKEATDPLSLQGIYLLSDLVLVTGGCFITGVITLLKYSIELPARILALCV